MAGGIVIERPLTEAQSTYDELCEQRRNLNAHSKLRRESLENIPKYAEILKELEGRRIVKKNLELSFDEKEPSHKNRIDALKDQIDAIEAKLTGLALDHFKKTGAVLELVKRTKSGKEKKIRIGFAFRQLSLF